MSRPLRIEYKDAFYHVIQRGIEKRSIFKKDADKARFLKYIDYAYLRYQSIIHTYVLMDNHYHIIIQTPMANLSKIMHYLNCSYAAYYNFKYKRKGPLYQGRYKAYLVQQDEYLHHLSRYIHLNPVRAGIVQRPSQYPWSSYKYFVLNIHPPQYLNIEYILFMFDKRLHKAKSLYKQFVNEALDASDGIIRDNTRKNIVIGDEDFLDNIQDIINSKDDIEIPTIKEIKQRNNPTLDQLKQLVTSIVRDNNRLSRKLSIYLSRKYTQRKHIEIASFYGKITYAGVSKIWNRVEAKRKKDKQLDRLIRLLENRICPMSRPDP